MPCAWLMSFVFLFFVTACSDSDESTNLIKVSDESELEQTLSADQQTSTISFVAASDWTSTVTETTTSRSTASWITLDPDHGSAGSYTISIILEPNETGETRTAVITIICGDTQITINITQASTFTTSELYLIEKINIVNNYVTSSGHASSIEDIWYFTYDDNGRVIKMYTNDSADGVVSLTYEGNNIIMVDEGEDNYVDKTTFTLGEDGYVTSFTSVENDQYTTTGTLTYSDGYVVEGRQTTSGSTTERIDKAEWENGNLIRVSSQGGGGYESGESEMSYDNPNYVNNPNINMDLNYAVCSTEWLDCIMFGGRYLQVFGYMGKRSALYMTEERDLNSGDCYTYTYEFDELGRPITIKCVSTDSEHYQSDEYIYTITYK